MLTIIIGISAREQKIKMKSTGLGYAYRHPTSIP